MKAHLPDNVRFGREVCSDYQQSSSREWWLANGLGGYASGTISQSLTRRYHGLLIAPTQPPLGRHLVFAKADATLHDGDQHYPLFSNRWGSGAVEPNNCIYLDSFRLSGTMPVWRYVINDLIIEQCIWMEHGHNTTYIAWRLVNEVDRPISLTVDLLTNQRGHHHESNIWDYNPYIEGDGTQISLRQNGHPALYFKTNSGKLSTDHQWIEDFALTQETERGLADRDAHLCVAHLNMQLWNEWSGVVASLEEDASIYVTESMRRKQAHDTAQLTRAGMLIPELCETPCWIRQLLMAADSFLIARPVEGFEYGESVIAGYPWFGDWGRDTMIALPGLTLKTGRFSSAKNILMTFAKYVDQGMLPNTFPEHGEQPQYNTVDAALWYIEAWRSYLSASNDSAGLKEIYPLLVEIIDWHLRGTRYGIGIDTQDGLLRAGEEGTQLTWMDAKISDWVVTPRHGKPVEVNALWYNALECMAEFSRQLNKKASPFEAMATQVRNSFTRFIKPEGGLYDVLDGATEHDASVRPNQIFAVSLHYSPLEHKMQAGVVKEVAKHLLTPYGLRSLSPESQSYHPHYEGNVLQRDAAYHQGTVWAWLLPHFALAEHRVTGDADLALSRLDAIRQHFMEAGLGTISEIFDGDYPHTPRGAPAQAWSVACVLEAWVKLERARRKAVQQKHGKHIPIKKLEVSTS
ncbi:amylo-alpha-1,6-glucosidase [Methylotenera sp.]|uniref:amylo-alpha-1,6-glucosidase n=1 Tax=Methylotenera sp. TaxID=2051956 RepID=UPI002734AF2D|nr:amylo-alpha-1,6-glucosidase [Methylotenera sp.]MDP3004677.1 amylo-alpha-1,6-glucosidase [Methylotenera sp.]